MRIPEKTNLAAKVIAVLALPPVILAKPVSRPQETTPAPPPATSPQTKTAPRPNPNAAGIYHIGDGVTVPKLIYSVEPEFSEKARKLKLGSATTTLSFNVDPDGHVRDLHVVKSCADAFTNKKDREAALTLDQQALKAASQYRFEAAQYQGKPVPVELKMDISFQVF